MEVSKFENDEFLACIDDLLDFSEDEITNRAGADVSKVEFPVGVPQKMVSPEFPAGDFAVQDSGDLYVPCDDLEELEWLSTFFEDCMPTASAGIPPKQSKPDKPAPALAGKPLKETTREEFRTSSPTSVLEATFPLMTPKPETAFPRRETTIPARRRTKRPRPTFAKVCWSFPRIISRESSPENQSEEFSSGDEPQMPENNSGKRKLQPGKENTCEINRRCMHCAIQKTPQWRTGPMGPKTLCNACGVRYKSGRLLPEYRPAASPTFIPSRHSNSHRKVMEMRIKKWNKEKQDAPAEERLLLKPSLDN